MIKICTLYVIILFAVGHWCSDFRQERAKVKVCNPKYVRNCVVFTARKSRTEPYLTNMTGTILMPFGNNVSFAVTLQLKSGGDFRLEAKGCDTLKHKWMQDFMIHYSNLTVTHCPFPAGTYRYMNMELPPKNIPIPIADGDYFIRMEVFVTATREPILDILTLLHFDQNKKGTYSFVNLDFPPKNTPLPIPKGKTYVQFDFFNTGTKESMLEFSLYVDVQ